jgi:two-component system, NarL family, response regulator NreC
MDDKIKLLIVDDHKVFADGISELIRTKPYIDIIGCAHDDVTAIRMAHELKPQYIIMDIGLQKKDGIEISKELLKSFPGLKIIILSMHSSYSYISRAFEAGVNGYVLKDASYFELLTAIDVVMQGKVYISEQIATVYNRIQQRELNSKVEKLTEVEKIIWRMTVEGKSPKEISISLDLPQKEILNYKLDIMNKMGVENDVMLVKYALKTGLITLEE